MCPGVACGPAKREEERMTPRVFALWRRWAMPGRPDGNGGYLVTVDSMVRMTSFTR
jgi:hypothetical protein